MSRQEATSIEKIDVQGGHLVAPTVAPTVASIGAPAALTADHSIEVERDTPDSADTGVTPPA